MDTTIFAIESMESIYTLRFPIKFLPEIGLGVLRKIYKIYTLGFAVQFLILINILKLTSDYWMQQDRNVKYRAMWKLKPID